MKRIFCLILAASSISLVAQTVTVPLPIPPAAAFTPAVPADKVVVSVGDLKITAAQFNDLIEMLPEQSRTAARGAGRRQFADELVRILTLVQEGKRLKLDQNPVYKAQAEFQAENLLAGRTYAEISKVNDADLRKYYEEHKGGIRGSEGPPHSDSGQGLADAGRGGQERTF